MPLNMAIGFPAMTFGLGIVTILMGQRQYIETGVAISNAALGTAK